MKNQKKYVVVYQTFSGMGELSMDEFDNKGDCNRRYRELTENRSLAWKLELIESNCDEVLGKRKNKRK